MRRNPNIRIRQRRVEQPSAQKEPRQHQEKVHLHTSSLGYGVYCARSERIPYRSTIHSSPVRVGLMQHTVFFLESIRGLPVWHVYGYKHCHVQGDHAHVQHSTEARDAVLSPTRWLHFLWSLITCRTCSYTIILMPQNRNDLEVLSCLLLRA